ncbi:MAG: CBS domain-containing protein [Planctomycetes bacterium]|nr:CBS domain-containing protein [Planctomycetota bacterium]
MTKELLAKDMMRRPVRSVPTGMSIREATRYLLRQDISGALVIDEQRRPVGVFSLKDVALYVGIRLADLPEIDPHQERIRETGEPVPTSKGFHFHAIDDTVVENVMTPGVITVSPDAAVNEVARVMTRWKVHRVFVEEQGTIQGIITSMDALKVLSGEAGRGRKAG